MQSRGVVAAVKIFKKAARSVPAYSKLLKKRGVAAVKITEANFSELVPVVDKKSYIAVNELDDLLPKGPRPPMAYASSGSSGTPTFWFRGDEQGERAGKIHFDLFKNVFMIKPEDSTLLVVCFSMGAWVAGNFTLEACRHVSRLGFNLTTVTPGIEREDIFSVFTKLAPKYKNLIIAGYPPFLMDVVCEAKERGIPLNKNTFALTAGDTFSEEWRTALMKEIKTSQPTRVVNIYGCADAGMLGYETEFSIRLRRKASSNSKLRHLLFGDQKQLPALVQYDQDYAFFENHNGELMFTVDTTIPLIRYNIHDIGSVCSAEQMQRLVKKFGLAPNSLQERQMGFVIKKGRTDVAVTYYALNIYPENISSALERGGVSKYLTGSYLAYSQPDANQKNEKLYFEFQLAEKTKISNTLLAKIKKALINGFVKENMEYRKLWNTLGKSAEPFVTLKKSAPKKVIDITALLQEHGKKPKMIAVVAD